jgi:P27 family predicted phage terminase small subunit
MAKRKPPKTPPKLTLVSPATSSYSAPPPPPDHLSEQSKEWWRAVNEQYDLEPHALLLLKVAAETWDRLQQAREVIDREGLTVPTKNGLKTHPAIGIERDSRLAFARIVRELNLDLPVEAPSHRRH